MKRQALSAEARLRETAAELDQLLRRAEMKPGCAKDMPADIVKLRRAQARIRLVLRIGAKLKEWASRAE